MTATSFIDTNVLLYAGSKAPADQAKRQVARTLLTRSDIGFSAQVLQEFYADAVTKQRLQITHDEAVAVLQSLAAFPVWPISRELVLAATDANALASRTGMRPSSPRPSKWAARRCSVKI
jgi:predicted nucleic acid-binding protein